jgi:hypothetical protein
MMPEPKPTRSTASIKLLFQLAFDEPHRKEALADFNRWLTDIVDSSKEEGRQEERERIEAQKDVGLIVFVGPYEWYDDYQQAHDRLEELCDHENRYGTMISALRSGPGEQAALGLTVQAPVLNVAEPGAL